MNTGGKQPMRSILYLLQEPANNAEDNCDNNTGQDHSCNRKIKAEILFFNPDITRQMTDPMQFIMEEINHQADDHHSAANAHQILAGI